MGTALAVSMILNNKVLLYQIEQILLLKNIKTVKTSMRRKAI